MSTQDKNKITEDQYHNMPNEASDSAEQEQVQQEGDMQEAETAGDESGNGLTELQKKYDTLNDKYLRLYSEFENYRRRTSKEKIDSAKVISSQILKEFLPVADDFDRAIAGNENDDDIDSIKEGFKLIYSKLMRTLESNGVKPMNAHETPFDTEFHEAITNVPAPDESLKGKVVDVAEKGYFYHDNVLRYAKVVVGQ